MKRLLLFAPYSLGIAFSVLFFFPFLGRAITVGPVRLEFSANPGETVQGQMFLQNDGSETQTFYPSFERFTEVKGEKVFLKDTTRDLPTWMEFAQQSSTLATGRSQTIPFTIRVPKDASPGGHFAVIWWSTAPPAGSGHEVSIATRAGVLLYLRVSGEIREEASVTDFSAKNRLIFSLPLSVETNFKNSGNVFITPAGTVTLESIFGGVQASAPLNQYSRIVMPDADYTFAASLNPPGIAFGPYNVKLDVAYGEKQAHIVKSFWVFILPIWLLGLVIALIILIFLLPWAVRRYNAWIVKKAAGR